MTSSPAASTSQPDGDSQETLRQRYELELREASELREQLKKAHASAATLERLAVEAQQSLERAREQIDKLWAL